MSQDSSDAGTDHCAGDTERAEIVFRDGDGYEIGRMRLEDQEESEPHFLPDSISVEFRSLRPDTDRNGGN